MSTPSNPADFENLNVRQLKVLKALCISSPKNLTELSKEAQCTSAGLTSIRDKLVKLGFVKEDPSQDRRTCLVSITEEGREVYKKTLAILS